ncbi:MAG: NUDIX domain-containing protein, partial [Mesorhizobium sp.]
MNEARKTLPAVSVAVVRADTLLLVKRARQPSQGLYAFPGGKVEPGETLE